VIKLLDLEIKVNPSFYKKVNHEVIKLVESETIMRTTLEAEKRCKIKAPGPGNQLPGTKYKAVGRLRRSHSTKISSSEGLVKNSTNYAVYVIHGTRKMPARNYPQEVVNELVSEQYMSRTMLTGLRRRGVID